MNLSAIEQQSQIGLVKMRLFIGPAASKLEGERIHYPRTSSTSSALVAKR